MFSCVSKKELIYLQGIDAVEKHANKDYTPVFKPDDQLLISVTTADNEPALPFNIYKPIGKTSTSRLELEPYLVDVEGNIEFPELGKLQVVGMTRVELKELLKEKLQPYLNNPRVTVDFQNFKITVLGDVKNPGSFKIESERISILDALGMAGDLNVHGERKNILVIREVAKDKKFYRIDLTSPELFDSPVFYLEQNDVVYVEPNKAKINSSATSPATYVWISVASVVIALLTLITR